MTEISRRLLVLGGGGHAAVVADAARSRGWTILGCLDDNPSADNPRLKRIGCINDLQCVLADDPGAAIHAANGDPGTRERWLLASNCFEQPAIIHEHATISPSSSIGKATFVGPQAVVNAGAQIGFGVIINSAAIVEHDVTVGDFSHIAPRAVLAGNVSIGSRALVGCGAVVLPGVTLGDAVTIGAGAVVTRDVPEHSVVVGVPGRIRST